VGFKGVNDKWLLDTPNSHSQMIQANGDNQSTLVPCFTREWQKDHQMGENTMRVTALEDDGVGVAKVLLLIISLCCWHLHASVPATRGVQHETRKQDCRLGCMHMFDH